MASMQGLSDKALAVFAFAAYHQLESGQRVSSVVRRDSAGHQADSEAIAELEAHGLATADDAAITFTPTGEEALQQALQGLKGALGGA